MKLMAERFGPFRRLLAAGAAGLVFLLGLAAASPDLHARVHGNVVDHDDAGCVIALFGHGVSLAAGTADLVVVPIEWQAPPQGSAATSYLIEAGSVSGLSDLGTLPLTATSFQVTVPAGRYYVRVRAVNASGTSTPGGEVVLDVP